MTAISLQKSLAWLLAAAIVLQPAAAYSCFCPCAIKTNTFPGDVSREPAKPRDCCHGRADFFPLAVTQPTFGERLPVQGYQPCRCDGACACKGRSSSPAAIPTAPPPRVGTSDFSQAAACLFVILDVVETDVRAAWNCEVPPYVATPPDLCAHLCRWLF